MGLHVRPKKMPGCGQNRTLLVKSVIEIGPYGVKTVHYMLTHV